MLPKAMRSSECQDNRVGGAAGSGNSPPSFSAGGQRYGLEAGSRSKQNRRLSETSTSGRRTLSGWCCGLTRAVHSLAQLSTVGRDLCLRGCRVGPGAGRPSFASQVAPVVANHQSCRHQGPGIEVLPVTSHGQDGGPSEIQNPKHGGERGGWFCCAGVAHMIKMKVWGCSGPSDSAGCSGCSGSNNAIFLDERLLLRLRPGRGKRRKRDEGTSATRACSSSKGHLSAAGLTHCGKVLGPATRHWPGRRTCKIGRLGRRQGGLDSGMLRMHQHLPGRFLPFPPAAN